MNKTFSSTLKVLRVSLFYLLVLISPFSKSASWVYAQPITIPHAFVYGDGFCNGGGALIPTLQVMDLHHRIVVDCHTLPDPQGIKAAIRHPRDGKVYFITRDGTFYRYDRFQSIQPLQVLGMAPSSFGNNKPLNIDVHPNGQFLYLVNAANSEILLVDLNNVLQTPHGPQVQIVSVPLGINVGASTPQQNPVRYIPGSNQVLTAIQDLNNQVWIVRVSLSTGHVDRHLMVSPNLQFTLDYDVPTSISYQVHPQLGVGIAYFLTRSKNPVVTTGLYAALDLPTGFDGVYLAQSYGSRGVLGLTQTVGDYPIMVGQDQATMLETNSMSYLSGILSTGVLYDSVKDQGNGIWAMAPGNRISRVGYYGNVTHFVDSKIQMFLDLVPGTSDHAIFYGQNPSGSGRPGVYWLECPLGNCGQAPAPKFTSIIGVLQQVSGVLAI